MNCPICLEELNKASAFTITSCNHMFHTKCIEPWLDTNSSCPCCRKDTGDKWVKCSHCDKHFMNVEPACPFCEKVRDMVYTETRFGNRRVPVFIPADTQLAYVSDDDEEDGEEVTSPLRLPDIESIVIRDTSGEYVEIRV